MDKTQHSSLDTAHSSRSGSQPLEDRALKEAARLFGEELMPLVGIKGTVKRIAPTEQIKLAPQSFNEDFNYEMTDGSWTHLEFESDSIQAEDLRRFHVYEALISYNHKVKVYTCVLCSSKVRNLKHSLNQGLYTYKVKLIRLKDKNADRLIPALERRQKRRGLRRRELLDLLLTPLMDGAMSHPERISRGIRMLKKERGHVSSDELTRMESVLYTLAMKFLNEEELKKIREEIRMTVLGEMILQDGIEQGIQLGIEQGIGQGIEQGLEQGIKGTVSILEAMDVPPQTILVKIQKQYNLSEEEARKYLQGACLVDL